MSDLAFSWQNQLATEHKCLQKVEILSNICLDDIKWPKIVS